MNDGAPRGRLGLAMAVLAAAGVTIATYLTWQHLAGTIPPCGPVRGCETVLVSAYAAIAGVPVALVGGIVGLSSVPGKMGWGVLSDRTNCEVAYTLAFGCLVMSLGVLVLAGRYPASALPYLYAILLGLGYAATAPLTPAAASDLFSGPRFSTIFGTLHVANALGAGAGDGSGSFCAFRQSANSPPRQRSHHRHVWQCDSFCAEGGGSSRL